MPAIARVRVAFECGMSRSSDVNAPDYGTTPADGQPFYTFERRVKRRRHREPLHSIHRRH